MLKGQIEIVIRDADTLEVVDRIVQDNIVTNSTFTKLISSSPSLQPIIVANGMNMAPSRVTSIIPGNLQGNVAIIGTAIPGNGNPDFFPRVGSTPAISQWSTRLALPSVDRTFRSIMLTDTNQNQLDTPNSNNGPYANVIYAFANLASPCIQTTTQFFDIYYRIFFPLTNQHDMPTWLYENMIKRMLAITNIMNGNNNYTIFYLPYGNALPIVTPNVGDEEIVWPSWTSVTEQYGSYLSPNANVITPSALFRRQYLQNLALTDVPGKMIGSIYFGAAFANAITASTNVDIGNKIQNLLGHRATSTAPFLDISNLQQGTGSITLGGDWDNIGTPSSPGLYYTGKIPEMFFVNVVGSGAVGTAGYTYSKRPFLGTYSNPTHPMFVNTWRQTPTFLPYISQSQSSTPSINPEIGNNLLGDLTKLGVRQLSSWCKYDDTSIVIVKMDQVIIYNMATGKYWSYTGGFTDIRQVTVIGTKVYLGCHSTGLYMIDPPNSGSVTGPIVPGGTIDLSVVYGVARGFSNMLWVAGANCLASFDGTTWTKYDSTTGVPFNIAGISDSNWSNIEYLSVDEENANHEMLIVRKFDATVNPTSLGVWWSTIGTATNHGTTLNSTNGTGGAPRLNRTHLGGRNGIWAMMVQGAFYRTAFASTSFTLVYGLTGELFNISSIMFAKNPSNVTRWLSLNNPNYLDESPLSNNDHWIHPSVRLVDSTGTTETSVTSSLVFHANNNNDITSVASSNINTTGNSDLGVSFLLGNGLLFGAAYRLGGAGGICINSFVGCYPFDSTYTGGALAYLGQSNYGWTGSAWSTAVTTPRTVHSSVEALDEGVTIAFTNGGSGTSFVDTDWYNFVCCQGLQKDSATTATFEYAFYYKRSYRDQTVLSASTIPTPTALSTGIVGLDLNRSSSNDITLVSNQFVFAGANPQQFAIGDKQVTGSFEVSYTPFNNALGKYIAFGIGHASSGQILYGFIINNDTISVCDTPNDTLGVFAYPSLHGSFGTFSASTDLTIKRVGNQLQFLVNSSIVWTVNLPASQIRFDLICTPYNDYQPVNWLANRICPVTTIVSNGSDNAVRIGQSIDSSGSFNPLFFAIDSDTRNTNTVTIGGTPAIAYHYDGTSPGPTEVTIDPYMGTLHFNSADQGSTVSAIYTYLTHE